MNKKNTNEEDKKTVMQRWGWRKITTKTLTQDRGVAGQGRVGAGRTNCAGIHSSPKRECPQWLAMFIRPSQPHRRDQKPPKRRNKRVFILSGTKKRKCKSSKRVNLSCPCANGHFRPLGSRTALGMSEEGILKNQNHPQELQKRVMNGVSLFRAKLADSF